MCNAVKYSTDILFISYFTAMLHKRSIKVPGQNKNRKYKRILQQRHSPFYPFIPPRRLSILCPSCSPAATVWGSSVAWGWAVTGPVWGAETPAPAGFSPGSITSAATEPGGPDSAAGSPDGAELSGAPRGSEETIWQVKHWVFKV